MAVRIKFDNTHNVIPPTLVLTTRNGRRLGQIPAYNVQFKDGLNECAEMTFRVNKIDCVMRSKDVTYIRRTPITIYNIINHISGYDDMGTMNEEQIYELIQYVNIYEKLSDVSLRFTGRNIKLDYDSPSIKYSDEGSPISVYDRDGNIELLRIMPSGVIQIFNAGLMGFAQDENVLIELNVSVPTSVTADRFWKKITDFKLCWVRDWDMYFEIDVDVEEDNDTIKIISAKSLAESELSQIYVYEFGANTDDDIARDDYKPTVLYSSDPSVSLLDRILEKAPHYTIGHVDSSLAKIQRTFSFDNKTIYDALIDIGKEINCLILMNARTDSEGYIIREINVYDLEQQCLECGKRGEFASVCPECGSENLRSGYGKDTSIFVSTENLANNVKYTVDNGSVKNCFKLEGGDELMTAAIASCNPNGSPYIWNISQHSKEDMSKDLVEKLESYDEKYLFYQKEFIMNIPESIRAKYNKIVEKYQSFDNSKKKVESSFTGYPSIMQAYYDTIDFYYFLKDELMPKPELIKTTAYLEAARLSYASLSPVAVKNVEIASAASIDNSVLSMAKILIDNRYTVKIKESTYVDNEWSGIFTVVNNSNEDDAATTGRVSCLINDDYVTFVQQSLDKSLHKNTVVSDGIDIVNIFKMSEAQLSGELKKYSLSRLESFHDGCQSCLDILIQQGIANDERWEDKSPNLYRSMYVPMYAKFGIIEEEMKVRKSEIEVVAGRQNTDGSVLEHGLQTLIDDVREKIQNELNFQDYLGEELWLEFCSYRREGTYQNQNYVSDGLNNAELFQFALQFIEVAEKEILKSSTLQHSISSTLKNLLAIKEFEPIIDTFELGNWIRVKIDDDVYKLRIIHYDLNFDKFDSISIEFSDVTQYGDITTDVADIINQAASMATSYGSVVRQAKKGNDGNSKLDAWIDRGLALTKMKIVDSADNQNITWDNHGLLCKEYLPITDNYDDKQLKIINNGLYLTDDSWETSKAGIGNFVFYNPKINAMDEAYGVIADTLVGNLILGESVGIYNTKNSITLDENGFILTVDKTNSDIESTIFTIQKKYISDAEEVIRKMLYLDSDGDLVLDGTLKVLSSYGDDLTLETVAEPVENALKTYASMLISNEREITQKTLESYVTITDSEEMRSELETKLSVLSDGVNITVSNQNQVISDLDGRIQDQINNITAHYRFTDDGQYIGLEGSDAVMRLFNDVMQIIVGGNIVTTVDRRGLSANVANVMTLSIGDYLWKYNENDGHLSLT